MSTTEMRGRQVRSDVAGINRRIMWRLMPLLMLIYVISFLDRTNIGMAKDRMEIDLGISAAAYGLGAGLFFLAYAALEIPSNMMMHKVGARAWIGRIMITWGIISGLMAIVWNEASFYVMRILLGAAEAGLFPGVMLYLTYWFGRDMRARANGYFLIGACIASVLGGPVGGLLLQMDGVGGLHGWQWMFIIEAIPAVLLSFVVFFKLPNRPHNAKWLSKDEADEIVSRLEREAAETVEASGTRSFLGIFKDRTVMFAIYINFAHQISLYSVTYFLPSVIAKSNGSLPPWLVGSFAAIPWLFGGIGAALITPRVTRNARSTKLAVVVGVLAMTVGTTIGVLAGPVFAIVGLSLAGLFWFVVQPIMFSVPSTRLSGVTLASGLALMNTVGITGGFVGPTVMGFTEQATGNTFAGLWLSVVLLVLAAVAAFFLDLDPTKKAAKAAGITAAMR
ncbi:MAG: MFS transporter [Arthrobacter sp.]|jgi:MFS family permease|nr:MFS transporter [Arthrobacter sp.]